ncbi:hypothetical protein DFH28DRAFT_975288 [Melampsora americana]|nr:hypothetical protein DFH28DRAFT_975288 [Melampsora americana]
MDIRIVAVMFMISLSLNKAFGAMIQGLSSNGVMIKDLPRDKGIIPGETMDISGTVNEPDPDGFHDYFCKTCDVGGNQALCPTCKKPCWVVGP